MIKVTKNDRAATPSSKYPVLMKCKESSFIVLFYAYACGVVVCSGSGAWKAGHNYGAWGMQSFELYNGAVTIENV